MDVIILAGGKGTRLQSVVSDVPKPMAPVNGKPFLEYILRWVAQYKVSKFILSIGYKGEVIKSYFKDSFENIPIVYAEEPEPLGTGGGIQYASRFSTSEDVLIINGDTWFPISLSSLWDFHKKEGKLISIALKEMEKFDRYGSVELSDNLVTKFNEKKFVEKGLINGGIYVLNKKVFADDTPPSAFSFESEILEKKIEKGVINGLVFNDSFIDIGIPEDYRKASHVL